jgi:hypothetical protein
LLSNPCNTLLTKQQQLTCLPFHMGLALNLVVLGLLFAAPPVCVPAKHIIVVLIALGVSFRSLVVLGDGHTENTLLADG